MFLSEFSQRLTPDLRTDPARAPCLIEPVRVSQAASSCALLEPPEAPDLFLGSSTRRHLGHVAAGFTGVPQPEAALGPVLRFVWRLQRAVGGSLGQGLLVDCFRGELPGH